MVFIRKSVNSGCVIQYVFDSLKRTGSKESFVWGSEYTHVFESPEQIASLQLSIRNSSNCGYAAVCF